VGTVPKFVEAIGLFATFADKTRIEREGLLVMERDRLDDGRTIETDKIRVTSKPPCTGFLVIPTIPTQVAKGHAPWQHQQQTHPMA